MIFHVRFDDSNDNDDKWNSFWHLLSDIYVKLLNVSDIVACKTHKNQVIILTFTLDEGIAAS